jgi:hypothetical protein
MDTLDNLGLSRLALVGHGRARGGVQAGERGFRP